MIKEEPVTLTTQDGVKVDATLHFDDAVAPKVALTLMHPTSDWRQHFMVKHLAQQGIGALGLTTRYTVREAELILEETLLDMAAGIEFLRDRGYARVLGIGSSGGAEIVAAYQSEAVHPTIKGTPLGEPPDLTKAKLPPFDGLIFLNPHMGRPLSITRNLDPSVGGENGNDPLQYDPTLDIYNPENGPPYSDEFRRRYEAAQVERNNKITRWCKTMLQQIERVGNPNMKDIPFIVYRTSADMHFLDKTLDPSDRTGQTIWDEDARYSNYTPGPLRGNRTRLRVVTLRSWLSQRGLETSCFNVLNHAANCNLPTLVIVGTAEQGGPRHALEIFDSLPDAGKKLLYVKDATHFMRGQTKQQAETAALIKTWLLERSLY